MDNTLIVYDTTGHILSLITGSYYIPIGVPYLEVIVPTGKIIKEVNISVTPNAVVYENAPISEIEKLKADIDYIAMMGGIEL